MPNDLFKKFLLFVLVALTIFATIKAFDKKNQLYENIKSLLGNSVTENISEQDITPLKSIKEVQSTSVIGSIYVPYYWKSGINTTEKDYLKGYVPTLSDFQKYYSTTQSVLYNKKVTATSQEVSKVLNDVSSYVSVKGIVYSGDFFKWNDVTCSKVGEYFSCPNWINWSGIPSEDKYYVVVECKIDNESGKCIFEDYTKEYYKLQRSTETRCYGSDNSYYCNINDYLKVLQSN